MLFLLDLLSPFSFNKRPRFRISIATTDLLSLRRLPLYNNILKEMFPSCIKDVISYIDPLSPLQFIPLFRLPNHLSGFSIIHPDWSLHSEKGNCSTDRKQKLYSQAWAALGETPVEGNLRDFDPARCHGCKPMFCLLRQTSYRPQRALILAKMGWADPPHNPGPLAAESRNKVIFQCPHKRAELRGGGGGGSKRLSPPLQ